MKPLILNLTPMLPGKPAGAGTFSFPIYPPRLSFQPGGFPDSPSFRGESCVGWARDSNTGGPGQSVSNPSTGGKREHVPC